MWNFWTIVLKRLHYYHDDNNNHENGRYFIDQPEKPLWFLVLVRFKLFTPYPKHDVKDRQANDHQKFHVKPWLTERMRLRRNDEAKDPAGNHGRVPDDL